MLGDTIGTMEFQGLFCGKDAVDSYLDDLLQAMERRNYRCNYNAYLEKRRMHNLRGHFNDGSGGFHWRPWRMVFDQC